MEATRASILIVDDEPDIRGLIAAALPVEEFEVAEAPSGEAAVDLARRRKFDLVVTDLYMPPGMDGLETVSALKAIDPDVEVVVATGHGTSETAITALKRGAYDYIEKPFNVAELRHLLGRALERSRLATLSVLYESSRELLASIEHPGLEWRVLKHATAILRAQSAALVTAADRTAAEWSGREEQVFIADLEPRPAEAEVRRLARRAIAARGQARSSGETVGADPDAPSGFRFSLAAPLLGKGEPSGCLVFLRGGDLPDFNAAEARRAALFAAQVNLVLENQKLCEALKGKVVQLLDANQRVVEAECRTRSILESAGDGIFGIDADGRVEEANAVGEALLGLGHGEVRGRALADLIAVEVDRRQVREWIRGLADEGGRERRRRLETRIARADGSEFAAELWLALSCTDRGVIRSAFLRDVSERRALEVELRHAQKLESVGRLASGVAHEINTPIQFVGDNVQFLSDSFRSLADLVAEYARRTGKGSGLAEPATAALRAAEARADLAYLVEEVPRALEQTREGVSRVATIVRAMRDFAHPDGSEKQEADLNHALQTTITVARNEIKNVADVETAFGDIPPVPCHVGDLNQVFLNLLVNAAHAIGDVVGEGGERGRIRVTTAREGDAVVVSVADTGSGIPEAIRGKVFEPFFTTKPVGRGTGQGLALARAIVTDRHGGSIGFDTQVGRGTTFHVRLPLAAARTAAHRRPVRPGTVAVTR